MNEQINLEDYKLKPQPVQEIPSVDFVGCTIKDFARELTTCVLSGFEQMPGARQQAMKLDVSMEALEAKIETNYYSGFSKIYRSALNDYYGKLITKKTPHNALCQAKNAALLLIADHFEEGMFNFREGHLPKEGVINSALSEYQQAADHDAAEKAIAANKQGASKKR